jgi:hypothetical protein
MSPSAHAIHRTREKDLSVEEVGVSDKKILIGSFKTTSKLFTQHFAILR